MIVFWSAIVYGIALAVVGAWAVARALRRCRRCRNPKYHCYCTEGWLR